MLMMCTNLRSLPLPNHYNKQKEASDLIAGFFQCIALLNLIIDLTIKLPILEYSVSR